jgi:hypothetical protein
MGESATKHYTKSDNMMESNREKLGWLGMNVLVVGK